MCKEQRDARDARDEMSDEEMYAELSGPPFSRSSQIIIWTCAFLYCCLFFSAVGWLLACGQNIVCQ